ncbi:MAG: FkbM family methyltransferase [Actinomycetota bacterium]
MRRALRALAGRFDLSLLRQNTLAQLLEIRRQYRSVENDFDLLRALLDPRSARLVETLRQSRSQLRQDLFVLSHLDFKTNGFFVEFGATDGVSLSNTLLLERDYGWSGIVAEPARRWHKELTRNRTCAIDTRCVWTETGTQVEFLETSRRGLSTISEFADGDLHSEARSDATSYSVATVSLNDLLRTHKAPHEIDYLSIDTEGSELTILESFDFSQHTFEVITCEHNFGSQRSGILSLLRDNGYLHVFEDLSKFDDWYIRCPS